MGFLLLLGIKSCVSAAGSRSDTSGATTPAPSTTATCPERIAAKLPSGDGAALVVAYRTKNKQIVLCRTTGGKLFYFGEFSDHRDSGIAMPAKRTSDGYEATNSPYRYVIRAHVVTIYKSGSRIGREDLTVEPSPK